MLRGGVCGDNIYKDKSKWSLSIMVCRCELLEMPSVTLGEFEYDFDLTFFDNNNDIPKLDNEDDNYKHERRKILDLSREKLKRIKDFEAELHRLVLIKNTRLRFKSEQWMEENLNLPSSDSVCYEQFCAEIFDSIDFGDSVCGSKRPLECSDVPPAKKVKTC